MDNTIQYIQKGDIVVLASEYTAFYREYDEASDELLRIVVDVNRSNIKLLSTKQLLNCLPHIPKFSLSKFNPIKYVVLTDLSFGVYGVHSFNQYGDAYKHWGLNRNKIIPMASLNNAKLNTEVIQGIKKFQSEVSAKGATLLVSFPVMQDISFKKSSEAIKKIEAQYIKNGFTILGTPERYMVPDSLLFDNTGHSTKEGADYRTQLLIEDLKSVLTHIAHYPE
ncbi:hypothetical protein FACS1894199_06280 [Bacteroidia bacterium]|nr:hypothetical protein FACS1894199_06280 [Bacteroidia bacterium]